MNFLFYNILLNNYFKIYNRKVFCLKDLFETAHQNSNYSIINNKNLNKILKFDLYSHEGINKDSIIGFFNSKNPDELKAFIEKFLNHYQNSKQGLYSTFFDMNEF